MKAYVILDGCSCPSTESLSIAHDVRAASEHGIIEALAEAGTTCWAAFGKP